MQMVYTKELTSKKLWIAKVNGEIVFEGFHGLHIGPTFQYEFRSILKFATREEAQQCAEFVAQAWSDQGPMNPTASHIFQFDTV